MHYKHKGHEFYIKDNGLRLENNTIVFELMCSHCCIELDAKVAQDGRLHMIILNDLDYCTNESKLEELLT